MYHLASLDEIQNSTNVIDLQKIEFNDALKWRLWTDPIVMPWPKYFLVSLYGLEPYDVFYMWNTTWLIRCTAQCIDTGVFTSVKSVCVCYVPILFHFGIHEAFDHLTRFFRQIERQFSRSGIEPPTTPFSLGINPLSPSSLGSSRTRVLMYLTRSTESMPCIKQQFWTVFSREGIVPYKAS